MGNLFRLKECYLGCLHISKFIKTLCILAFMTVNVSVAADEPNTRACRAIFPNAVQSYNENSQISFGPNAQLFDFSSNVLSFKSLVLDDRSEIANCGTSNCVESSDFTAAIPSFEFNKTSAERSFLTIPENSSEILGGDGTNDFFRVTVEKNAELSFDSGSNPTYRFLSITLQEGAKLLLPSGDYWINALTMDKQSSIEVVGDGTVRLFLNKNLRTSESGSINKNTEKPSQLIIYSFSSIQFHRFSETYALIYGIGDVQLNHKAKVTGAISASNLNLRWESRITYNPESVNEADFGSICYGLSKGLEVNITEPDSLITVGHSPLVIKGTVNQPNAALAINGIPIEVIDNSFEASVALNEGFNTIVASATDESGGQTTDSIAVSLDLTPPYITIESHENNQVVTTDNITVTGLVNDIVRGTVESEQAQVTVNGRVAEVSNRSYAAKDIQLDEGINKISITASDQVGNVGSKIFSIIYKKPLGKKLLLVSGQDQSATINEQVPEPLVVKLVDSDDHPLENESIVFRVIQDSGKVAINAENEGRAVVKTTDAQGIASTTFKVGYRKGVANNKVKATAVGVEGEVIFNVSAQSTLGNKLSTNSGNNQRGVVDQLLPAPLVVVVTDAGANTIKNAQVQFKATVGGGVFENGSKSVVLTTDSDGRASVRYRLGDLTGIDSQHIEAILLDAPKEQTILAGFSATAFIPSDPGKTSISGVVLDNQDSPIPGVTIYIEGTTRQTETDEQGQFRLTSVPIGPVHIFADGSTASVAGEFPSLSYRLVTVSGVDNPLSSPIYMVKLNTEESVYAGKENVELMLEKFPGFKLEIAKDSVTFPDGSREGYISVTAVNASAIPMAPPNGMQPQFIVTIQPTGTLFDEPARLTLPNVDAHPPGAQAELYSYDHDLEEFVSIGLGTVSEDGSVIRSNPGIGVVKAGWHCGSQPGGSGTVAACPECQTCKGSSCKRDPGQDRDLRKNQTPEDCKNNLCKGTEANPGDAPVEDKIKGDCRAPGCSGKSPVMNLIEDNGDIPEDDCGTCKNGKAILDTEKELPESKQKPDDCKLLMCGGDSKARNETSALKEKQPCKFCSAGEIEREEDDSKCGDGSTSQECYTCKDGNCGNYCTAKLDPPVKVGGEFAKGYLTDALNRFETALSVSPLIDVNISGVQVFAGAEQGKECCKDCREGPEPKEYTHYKGGIKGGVVVKAAVPGLGIVTRFPRNNFGGIVLSGSADLGLTGSATIQMESTLDYKDSKCKKDDNSCVNLTVAGSTTFKVNIGGIVTGEIESCDTKFSGWKKGKKKYDFSDCKKLIALGTDIGIETNITVKGNAKVFINCDKASCSGFQVSPVIVKPKLNFQIQLLGIYQTTITREVEVKVSEDLVGGDCV